MEEKRQRGAPRGNHNALKHGFYAKGFDRKQKNALYAAADIEGIDAEIALLRYKIQLAASGEKVKNLMPLVKAAVALDKLIRTRHKCFAPQDRMENGIRNILRELLLPLGPDTVKAVAHFHYPDDFPADTAHEKQSPENPQ